MWVWLLYFEIFFPLCFCFCECEGEGSYPLLVLISCFVLCWVRILNCHGSYKWEMSGGDDRKWMRFGDNDFEVVE